ncbi:MULTISPECIES: hypothetical protein [Hyphobacterium]|uniref:DUF1579 domain-containing protein n=1 Tax=Hyphobacterium vulgare TaxID=1736751 RepID=A0ABV6ZZ46_9PROT
MRLTVSLIAALGTAAVFAPAATAQQGPPPGCDDIEGAHDFDFWVGDWNVYGQNGQLGGTNHIEKRSNGCLILEEWTNAGGGDGTSMNYLDPTSGQWRQIWMGSNSYIDYSGGLNEAGAMVLVGEITYFGATGSQTAPFRGTWTPNEDGSVTQHFQQYDEANDVWNDWFIGRYMRQEDDPNAN